MLKSALTQWPCRPSGWLVGWWTRARTIGGGQEEGRARGRWQLAGGRAEQKQRSPKSNPADQTDCPCPWSGWIQPPGLSKVPVSSPARADCWLHIHTWSGCHIRHKPPSPSSPPLRSLSIAYLASTLPPRFDPTIRIVDWGPLLRLIPARLQSPMPSHE